MSKEDPKHGRWILPLVIVGLVGLTYSFVNALPPAEVPLGTTTVPVTTSTLPPETTTTTLPPDIAAFLLLLDVYEATAIESLRRMGPAILGYAQFLYLLPLGVFGIAIATAIFPALVGARLPESSTSPAISSSRRRGPGFPGSPSAR